MPTRKAHAQLRSTFLAWGLILAGWGAQPWPLVAAACFAAGLALCVALWVSDVRHYRHLEQVDDVAPHPRRTPTHVRVIEDAA